jgi:hypothetical protein
MTTAARRRDQEKDGRSGQDFRRRKESVSAGFLPSCNSKKPGLCYLLPFCPCLGRSDDLVVHIPLDILLPLLLQLDDATKKKTAEVDKIFEDVKKV